MLLEEVASADTLLGPEEGTDGVMRVGVRGWIRLGWVLSAAGWAAVPDSRVRPTTEWLQGPEPMALKAWTCTRYSVHSSRSSMVYSRSTRSWMTCTNGCPRPSERAYRIL